jgi:thioredoxin-like negative regulator of GroEL
MLKGKMRKDPQSFPLRLKLANLLIVKGRNREALSQVQKARQGLDTRDEAMNLQGRI